MQFGGKQSHSGAVLPIMPAECTICRAGSTLASSIADEMREEHRRRVLGE
jgi:hypothetical protein